MPSRSGDYQGLISGRLVKPCGAVSPRRSSCSLQPAQLLSRLSITLPHRYRWTRELLIASGDACDRDRLFGACFPNRAGGRAGLRQPPAPLARSGNRRPLRKQRRLDGRAVRSGTSFRHLPSPHGYLFAWISALWGAVVDQSGQWRRVED